MRTNACLGTLRIAALFLLAGCSGVDGPCHSDDDCAGDLFCHGPNAPNVCGIAPREGCSSDADCFGGGTVCHAVADFCSPDGVGSQCDAPCTATNCNPGFRCGPGGACEPVPCDEGFTCPDHQKCDPAVAHASGVAVHARTQGCVDIACAKDADCPAGKACVNAFCQDGPGSCQEAEIVP